MTIRYSIDIVIFGGGVAGLWLLNCLRARGYETILLETDALGAGQSIASQGIIHGGLKYALSGSLTSAARTIGHMPTRWRSAIGMNPAGQSSFGTEQEFGEATGSHGQAQTQESLQPDLTGVKILSEAYYLWSGGGLRSKLKTFLGSKTVRGRVEGVRPADFPAAFATSNGAGNLYRLPDFVIDAGSLVDCLSRQQEAAIFKLPGSYRFQRDDDSGDRVLLVDIEGTRIEVAAQRMIFCAGRGNETLCQLAGLTSPRAQQRPLHMVYFRHDSLPAVYAHCIGDDFSLTPRLSVTTHPAEDGGAVWYLGGELAESGVGLASERQIDRARALVTEVFPWLELEGAEWHSFEIARAEADVNSGARPDSATLVCEDGIVVAWPTKLTLVPQLADQTLQELAVLLPRKETKDFLRALRDYLPMPPVIPDFWTRY